MAIYSHQSQALFQMLNAASQANSTILLPQLQRDYVWDQTQVVEFIDSLLKGWPFGTLLIWNLGMVTPNTIMVPSHGFGQHINRHDDNAVRFQPAAQGAEFKMILDGQQRIQSMLLAFNSNSSITMKDQKWRNNRAGGGAVRWSRGYLCVNLEKLVSPENNFIQMDGPNFVFCPPQHYEEILEWVENLNDGLDHDQDRPVNYLQPLNNFKSNTHIRLGYLYENSSNIPSIGQYEFIEQVFRRNGTNFEQMELDVATKVKFATIEICKKLKDLQNQQIHFLQIDQPNNLNVGDNENQYFSAIVEVFARLNSAGRTLTKEDIIFAWFRQYWPRIDDACEILVEIIKERSTLNIVFTNEDALRIFVYLWGMLDRNGDILSTFELRRANVLETASIWCRDNFEKITCITKKFLDAAHPEFGFDYKSQNALMPFLAISLRCYLNANGNIEQEHSLTVIESIAKVPYAKWIFGTQSASAWQSRTNALSEKISKQITINWSEGANCANVANNLVQWFLNENEKIIIEFINVNQNERRGFKKNNNFLMLWRLMSEDREDHYINTGHRYTPKDIDHILPYEYLKNFNSEDSIINSIGNSLVVRSAITRARGRNLYNIYPLFNPPPADAQENRENIWTLYLHAFGVDRVTPFFTGEQEKINQTLINRGQKIRQDIISFIYPRAD